MCWFTEGNKKIAEQRFKRMFSTMTFEQVQGAHRLLFGGPLIDKRMWRDGSRLLELCDNELCARYAAEFRRRLDTMPKTDEKTPENLQS